MALATPPSLSPRARRFFRENFERSPSARTGRPAPAVPETLSRMRAELGEWFDDVELGEFELGITLPHAEHATVAEVDGELVMLFGLRCRRDPIYLDARGRLYERPGWVSRAPLTLVAESMRHLIERHALHDALLALPFVVELDQRLGATLARALDVPPIEEASGNDAAWWGTPEARGLTMFDGGLERPALGCTTLLGTVAAVARALRTARGLANDVRAHVARPPLDGVGEATFTLHPPEEAPSAPPASAEVLRLAGPSYGRRIDGVLEARGDKVSAFEVHAGRVLVQKTWRDVGEHAEKDERRFLCAAARVAVHLSPAARASLPGVQLAYDPRDQLGSSAAEAMLRAAGVADPAPLLALEDALGGLLFGEDLHGLHFGLAAEMGPVDRLEADESGRFAFGRWSDARVLADARGRIHFVDDIDGSDYLLADDAAHFLERFLRPPDPGLTGPSFALDALVGESVAELLAASLVEALSDGARRVWSGGGALVEEGPEREGKVKTHVVVRSMQALQALAPSLAWRGVTASSRYSDVLHVLAAAGVPVARQMGEGAYEPCQAVDVADRVREARERPITELAVLAGDASAEVRLAVAERGEADEELLAATIQATQANELAEVVILDAVARHPRASVALVERVASLAEGSPFAGALLRAVATCTHAPADLLERLARDRRPEVRHAVASNSESPRHTIEAMARDADATVRRAAASNPAVSAEVLRTLATDAEDEVRAAVALAERTPDDALRVLAADPSSYIAELLARRRVAVPSDVGLRVAFHPWASRARVIAMVPVPERVLRDFAACSIAACRLGVASHAATPPDVLRALLDDDEPEVRSAALGHPSLAGEAREGVDAARAKHPLVAPRQGWESEPVAASLAKVLRRSTTRGAWASDPAFPPSMLAELADDPDDLVGWYAARHPWLPREALERLAKHRYESVRREIAARPETPDDLRAAMLEDPSAMVRGAAAVLAPLDEAAWERLASDPEVDVGMALARRSDCPPERLAALARDPREYVRRRVATNPRAPAELLVSMFSDAHPAVRMLLPLNRACPAAAIEPLLDDQATEVRHAAIWRLLDHRPYEALRRGA